MAEVTLGLEECYMTSPLKFHVLYGFILIYFSKTEIKGFGSAFV